MAFQGSSQRALNGLRVVHRFMVPTPQMGRNTLWNTSIARKQQCTFATQFDSLRSLGEKGLHRNITSLKSTIFIGSHVKEAACRKQCMFMPMRFSSVSAIVQKGLTENRSKLAGLPKGITKDSSPLTTKRIVRRKRSKNALPNDTAIYQALATSTAEDYQLSHLKDDLTEQGLYKNVPVPEDVEDTLHLEAIYRVADEPREIFIFANGSVVFWNMPEEERSAFLKFIRRHEIGSYDSILIESAEDNIEYSYNEKGTEMIGDEVQFEKMPEVDPLHRSRLQLEKYTYSDALSQSVKLSIWEASLEIYVDSIDEAQMALKLGNKIKLSEAQILQRAGTLMHYRHQINLNLDLLDMPDFYWDRPEMEALYKDARNHFNIARRTRVMNDKVTACLELVELLRDCAKEKVHTRLEWLIIVLIFIEVMFEVRKIIDEHREKKHEETVETSRKA